MLQVSQTTVQNHDLPLPYAFYHFGIVEIRTIEEFMGTSTGTVPTNSPGSFSPNVPRGVQSNRSPFDFSEEKQLEGDSMEIKKEE